MQAERVAGAGMAWQPGQAGAILGRRLRARRALATAGWLVGWLAVGAGLRGWSSGRFPLREDEALYAFWARLISSGLDPMLERVAVDKPPFFLYALAQFFTWFGPSEASGRLLSQIASFLSIFLVGALAWRMYGRRTAMVALPLAALSPFAISFAPTLYTDPTLTAWLLLALLAASLRRGRGLGWRLASGLLAGLALGMAFDTKQNALLFVPLVLGALVVAQGIGSSPTRRLLAVALSFLAAAAAFYFIWFKVWQWDGWRVLPAEIPSFWEQAWHTYGGLRLTSPGEWPGRMAAWAGVWRWLGGGWPGTLVLAGLAGAAAGASLRAVRRRGAGPGHAFDLLLAGFSLAYLLAHVAFTFQPWDRYLLPLAPLLALLAARGLVAVWQALGRRPGLRLAVVAGLAAVFVGGAGLAAAARIPVGGDHGGWSGIEAVARYLQQVVPDQRGVLYQRWEGWHWNWYLWDGPHGRVYWANPEMLVDDLRPDPTGYQRFVVFPAWHDDERPALAAALAPLGLRLAPRLVVRDGADGPARFTVYQITAREGE
ncbi:MAG: glycosyltransferase family 39 protein [Caldilineales bacterium]|nr:glycosyltransferase family 39 protein [Caldilineales bacterium]MCW5859364.1 glycosyltransferase family 39 protein [Caldilineales bacterium]